ncbi:MAG: PAS domain-containing protein, partial [Acidimicrobiia bacterium]|nr:PAS domain-containing protein [Acidimicrobiia bacterium]
MRASQPDHDNHDVRRNSLNPIVRRQLRRANLDIERVPDDLDSWASFLAALSDSFDEGERSRYITERSLEVSSEEMRQLASQIRVAAESDLTRERDRLRAMLDSMNDGMCALDGRGHILMANRVAAEHLGFDEQGLLDTPVLGRF